MIEPKSGPSLSAERTEAASTFVLAARQARVALYVNRGKGRL
jgi:hypothetical protein